MNLCSESNLPKPAIQTAPRPLTPGRVQRRRLGGHAWQKYFIYVPTRCTEGAPVLVAVHGISRNAREQARAFAPLAERYGVVVVAPLFPKSRYPRYQQLGISRGAIFPRPDLALDAILQEVGMLTGARSERVHLFGYSGGGQFAHRYAMAHPQRVHSVALGAPGWFTFPNHHKAYPRGTRKESTAGLVRFSRRRYLQVPMAVFVGDQDNAREPALKQSHRIDRQQGQTRLERGQRWIAAMQLAAQGQGLNTPYEFHQLAGCGHSFAECVDAGRLDWQVFDFLFGRLASAGGSDCGTTHPHLLFQAF